jgi:hypothetical protein
MMANAVIPPSRAAGLADPAPYWFLGSDETFTGKERASILTCHYPPSRHACA